ncbi:MAG: hypothetical protein CVU07_11325 [Bacteroidetes bacterium HGW-Bacteroidetes-23]|nr:MAG: hypothetical protein CVU07_11325 [Bacteroidetes bacterium HGW-Bacteroidetes-23]
MNDAAAVLAQQVGPADGDGMMPAHAQGLAVFRHGQQTGADEIDRRIIAQHRELTLDAVRRNQVVGVHPGDDVVAGQGRDLVEARGELQVSPVRDDPNPGILHRPGDLKRTVGGAVVHQQQLPIAMGLGEHRLDGPGQIALSVVEGNSNSDVHARSRRAASPEKSTGAWRFR